MATTTDQFGPATRICYLRYDRLYKVLPTHTCSTVLTDSHRRARFAACFYAADITVHTHYSSIAFSGYLETANDAALLSATIFIHRLFAEFLSILREQTSETLEDKMTSTE